VADVTFYHEHVAPLLADRCLGCHGSHEPAAGIDLGTIASLLGGDWPTIVPGRPDDSLLMQVVTWEGKPKMPTVSRPRAHMSRRVRPVDHPESIVRLRYFASLNRLMIWLVVTTSLALNS
jgi:hypothetical protein